MTKKTPKPTAQHMQKLADLMDTRPEGVTVQRVQDTLQVSPTLAKAALIEIGAVEQDGKWVFAEPGPVTIAESAPVEPVTIEPDLVTIEPQPELKKLTQAVFDGLSAEYRWAIVDSNQSCWVSSKKPERTDECQWIFGNVSVASLKSVGGAFDATDWQSSLIERDPLCTTCETKTDIAPLSLTGECQQCYEDATDKAWWDTQGGMFKPVEPEPVCTKSDFARVLEAERQRVYDAVAIGGTVERLAEITGLHVDDVQMHLGVLIDDGAIVEKPIVIAMSYGVAV